MRFCLPVYEMCSGSDEYKSDYARLSWQHINAFPLPGLKAPTNTLFLSTVSCEQGGNVVSY